MYNLTVRVDVDRYYPQKRISIEINYYNLIFPKRAHVIAEVTTDVCTGINRRIVTARITYRNGDTALFQGDQLVFEARRRAKFAYEQYTLTAMRDGASESYPLTFESIYFDKVEFEVDIATNAGVPVTTYKTDTHPNRPAGLPAETLSIATIFQRAGFDVSMSTHTSLIPASQAGANGTWSDSEMHNAMVEYWSRFANKPQWALWVLFAKLHDEGKGLGGVMFDDIGPNHRQGTAIFTRSFIADPPRGEANPGAWANRMMFWTAVHEMGHGFNLAHSWQKTLGQPWRNLADGPEARSFMNYPYKVAGGEHAFFSNFGFRFSDEELTFMRHAPRRFVEMGNSNWFVNHGFETPEETALSGAWQLQIRPNRELNAFHFLEPIVLELKLTNATQQVRAVNEGLLADGHHLHVMVQREGAQARLWRPLVAYCQQGQRGALGAGESLYCAQTIGVSTSGWLVDEPGFYKVQAALEIDGENVVSNVMRLYVTPPLNREEALLAPDYFTEDVGRALVFHGVPGLPRAMTTLGEVVERCRDNPAVLHARRALAMPKMRDFKRLDLEGGRGNIKITCDLPDLTQSRAELQQLIAAADQAAQTLGHIGYYDTLEWLAKHMLAAGETTDARAIIQASITSMKRRNILARVIQSTEEKLTSLT